MKLRLIIILSLVLAVCSCSTSSFRKAENIVQTADSLRACGILYDDSVALTECVAVLSRMPYRYLYPTLYAHANYYYGRLLQRNNNMTSAVNCYLNIIESKTSDYDICGRAFTNLAIMCRWEGNHQLAFNMFEKSEDCFLSNADTTAYLYALNSMAFEKAELAEKNDAIDLVNSIQNKTTDNNIIIKAHETAAEAYFVAKDYDSALIMAAQLQRLGYFEPTGMLIKAQSFHYLNCKDSALYYAQVVAEQSTSWFDLNNAYYILANDDSIADLQHIRDISSARSDLQKQIELRHSELSHAIEMLEHRINHKSMVSRFIVSVLILAFSVWVIILLVRKINGKKLISVNQQLEESNVVLQNQYQNMMKQYKDTKQNISQDIEKTCEMLRKLAEQGKLSDYLHLQNFDLMCEIVNKHFYLLANKLKSFNVLSLREFQLCVLVLIGLKRPQISKVMNYGLNGIGKLKDTAAKKLGTTSANLRNFLLDIFLKD